jgi:hypothetical protein
MKKNIMIRARVSIIDFEMLDNLAKTTGRTHSEIIRNAIEFLYALAHDPISGETSNQKQSFTAPTKGLE